MPERLRSIQRVGDLHAEPEDLVQRQRSLGDARGEGLALDQFHHQEVGLTLAPDVKERADVRMVEG